MSVHVRRRSSASSIEADGTDLLSVLLRADVDGETLTQFEIDVFFMLLQNAGSETTRNLITTGMLVLLQHPDQLDRLRGELSSLPPAIEEMLRWVTPVMHFPRRAGGPRDRRSADRGGRTVVIVYPSANRDETQFHEPRHVRHDARAQRARGVRCGRPALLPRRQPGTLRGEA